MIYIHDGTYDLYPPLDLKFCNEKTININYLKSQTITLCTMVQIDAEEITNLKIVHSFVKNTITSFAQYDGNLKDIL